MGKTFSLQYAQVRLSCALMRNPTPGLRWLAFWARTRIRSSTQSTSGRSTSHQMRAKQQRCAERVHGAKDEDDAPWTNLFTVHGLAPNHPVGRRTRKAGAPFLAPELEKALALLEIETRPRPRGDRRPTNFLTFASNKRIELDAARWLKRKQF